MAQRRVERHVARRVEGALAQAREDVLREVVRVLTTYAERLDEAPRERGDEPERLRVEDCRRDARLAKDRVEPVHVPSDDGRPGPPPRAAYAPSARRRTRD